MITTASNPATAPKEVIDKTVHRKILADMTRFCETANVPEKFVRQSMKSYCQDGEIEYVRQFNLHRHAGDGGLAIIGGAQSQTRCMAITGTLVRNFVDARIVTLNTVVTNPAAALEPTVLVVPNFYVKSFGKQLTAWQVQSVYDVLLNRLTANKLCVLYIENFDEMARDYGTVFADHIKSNFQEV